MRSYADQLRVWETACGRTAGWRLEHHGRPILELTEPRFEDMFWVSYRMTVLTTDPLLRERLMTETFWREWRTEGLAWRSNLLGEIVTGAFPAGRPFSEPGRLTMRALELPGPAPKPWDRVVLWLRRARSRR